MIGSSAVCEACAVFTSIRIPPSVTYILTNDETPMQQMRYTPYSECRADAYEQPVLYKVRASARLLNAVGRCFLLRQAQQESSDREETP